MFIVIKNFISYIRPYKLLSTIFFIALFLDLAFISIAPLTFKFMVDNAIIPQDFNNFYLILIVLGIAGLIGFSSGIVSDYCLAKLNARVQNDLRTRLFSHLQHTNISFFQKNRTTELVSYISHDVSAIDGAMYAILTTGIQSISVVIISTIILFYLQWSIALFVLLGAVIIFAGPLLLGRRAQAVNSEFKIQMSLMSGDVLENIKAQKVIKGFNLQQVMIEKFHKRLQSFFMIDYKKNVLDSSLQRIPMMSLLLINFTIIGFGSYLALNDHITVGALVAFFTMYTSMGNSVFNLTLAIPAFTDAKVSMERIQHLLDEAPEENGQSQLLVKQDQQLDIEVQNVAFRYTEKQNILADINLFIPGGTSAAFVGSSGSGKSTMLQLILGFYTPNEGQIRMNDCSLQDMDRGSMREQMGIVFQDNFLFRGTIMDNIRISKPLASDNEVREAARKAEIDDFIYSLPEGYQTEVLDEGSNFSGGQRQRIAIARAILRNPSILLLDEATSALDPISEESINQTFRHLSHDRTVITVTHRLSSITDADQIFVFDQGRIVDSGNHQQMLRNGGFYKELWDKQNGLSVSLSGQEAEIDENRLAKLPFFIDMHLEVLKEIKSFFDTETFSSGQTIIHEGEVGNKFYIIARGKVEVSKRSSEIGADPTSLAVLTDGDYFGEIALLKNVLRTADVIALTECTFLTLQSKVLHYVLSQYPELNARVRAKLQERYQ